MYYDVLLLFPNSHKGNIVVSMGGVVKKCNTKGVFDNNMEKENKNSVFLWKNEK